jgi:hypothetical protein
MGAKDEARGREVADPLEELTLALGHVNGRPGPFGEVGDAAEVVPVAVRDQDRDAARFHLGQLEADRAGVRARIDDHRLGRSGTADEVAVRPDRAEGKLPDVQAHGWLSLATEE